VVKHIDDGEWNLLVSRLDCLTNALLCSPRFFSSACVDSFSSNRTRSMHGVKSSEEDVGYGATGATHAEVEGQKNPAFDGDEKSDPPVNESPLV
jgi:hypothetical protein